MKNCKPDFWKWIVSGFGLGLIPLAPGTMGAIGALVPAILIRQYCPQSSFLLILLILVFTVLGIIGTNKMIPRWGEDPSKVVVDEMVGMWVALLWTPSGWLSVILAFILFRMFDIAKPLGIRSSEKLPGGWGVMVDDVLAGIYSNIFIQIVFLIFPGLFAF
ncbi:MAG: phosphatidylglycerophosphatase A [Bacteroidales bacterium]|nr:phosphatidylglycerophosphatase A [Bacteroidales bacterium]